MLYLRSTDKAIQSIGRKSVNAFTSKDIKKSVIFAIKYFKDIGVKSPFFRAFFGDWRAHEKNPVHIASIPEYINSNEARKANRGPIKNVDTGWIVNVSRQGETNTISHSGTEKLSEMGLSGIKDIIANAILLDTEVHKHHKNNANNDLIAFDHKLYALGTDERKNIALYKVTVEEYYQDYKHTNVKRFHNLKYITKVADISADALALNKRSGGSTIEISAKYNVSQLFDLVKRYDKNFKPKSSSLVLNEEDGTPLVVYHGTDAEFDVFDWTKGRSGMDIQGMFFSPWEIDAGGYGKNVGAYYLSLKNPASEALAFKALNMFKGQNYAGRKAREYLIKLGYDGVKGYDEYIAFYPEQIKSATDNIGTFDMNNQNKRFSLQNRNTYSDRIKGAQSDAKRELYSNFSIPLRNRTELNSVVAAAYRTIENGGTVSDRVKSAMYDILVDNSHVKDDSWAKENAEFIDYFKNLTFKIDDSVMHEIGNGKWADVLKAAGGKFGVSKRSGTDISVAYREASEMFPGLLDPDITNGPDQLQEIKGDVIMIQDAYEILTPEDIMEELLIGKNAVYSILRSGELKGFRVGRNWKIPRKAVEEYIDKKTK